MIQYKTHKLCPRRVTKSLTCPGKWRSVLLPGLSYRKRTSCSS